jgi:hypothetical protein
MKILFFILLLIILILVAIIIFNDVYCIIKNNIKFTGVKNNNPYSKFTGVKNNNPYSKFTGVKNNNPYSKFTGGNPRTAPVGLPNPRGNNYCWMNSSIQYTSMILFNEFKEIYDYINENDIKSQSYTNPNETLNVVIQKSEFLSLLYHIFNKLKNDDNGIPLIDDLNF